MLSFRRSVPVLVLAIAALASGACSKDDAGGVGVTEHDFEITLDSTSGSAGEISFNVHNNGPSTHEFVVFKTDLGEADLPLNEDGDVDEEGEGVTHIDELEDIAASDDVTLTVDLDAGGYVVLCNLPGHYKQGMHASFTVE